MLLYADIITLRIYALALQVAYAAKDLNASIIVDMATLTGAQGVSTGHYHAGIVTNDEDYEKACVQAGRWSGDLAVSIDFCDLCQLIQNCIKI